MTGSTLIEPINLPKKSHSSTSIKIKTNDHSFLSWAWAISGVFLILLVLLHSPKGDGMGGLASSGSSMFTSASSAESTLNRATWSCLILFLTLGCYS